METHSTTESVKDRIKKFMSTDPSEEEIEKFYMSSVLPHDSRSIDEILEDE